MKKSIKRKLFDRRTSKEWNRAVNEDNLNFNLQKAEQLLQEIKEDKPCKDIVYKEGQRNKHYYSKLNISDNYAIITSLVEDKDLVTTIAKMVRFNSKTYPAPNSRHLL